MQKIGPRHLTKKGVFYFILEFPWFLDNMNLNTRTQAPNQFLCRTLHVNVK